MKKVIKKLMSLMLSIVLAIGIIGTIPYSDIKASAATLSLAELQSKFPHGKYWNHAGSSTNNPNGYTSTPCSHHGNGYCSSKGYGGACGCNSFNGLGIQCFGFAYQLGYDAYGSNPANWSTTKSLDNVKPGDIIRYKNNGHSIFVTGVNGDTITYGDCNSDGHCMIMWNKTITKSDLWGLTHVRIAPSSLSGSSSTNTPPVLTVDSAYGGNGTITVRGWAYDPDDRGKQLEIHVYREDNQVIGTTICQYDDEDALKAVVGAASQYKHRFEAVFDVTTFGEYNIKIAALDDKGATATWSTGHAVTVTAPNNPPVLAVDPSYGGNGTITISGWAYDPDDKGKSLKIRVYRDDGQYIGSTMCQYDDEDALKNLIGPASQYKHRFKAVFDVSTYGEYSIQMAALDDKESGATWSAWHTVTVTAPQYTRTLDPQGGTCSKSSVTFTFGQKVGTLPTPTRTGYTFLGWYTAKTGGTKVTADTVPSTAANATWYAQWKANTYTRTLDPQGGKCDKTSVTVTYGQKVGTLPTPTKTGYTFLGWYNAKTGGTKVTADTVMWHAANATWYAQWKANTYPRTLDANGGTCDVKTLSFTVGEKIGELPVPTRDGYTFVGWYTAKEGGTLITEDSIMGTAATLTWYARWTKDKLYGDIYVDDTLNLLDVIYLQKFIIGIKELNDTQLLNADLNSDGRINVIDLALLKKAITA